MGSQKNFFYDYFDGQIIKEETQNYKLFKVMLLCLFSLAGLFCVLMGFCNIAIFALLELGMIWNFYVKLNNPISVVFCVLVSTIYFAIASFYMVYSHALIYMGFYIPFQMFATTKTYYGGDFVQIRKEMNDGSQIVFISLVFFASAVFYMFDYGFGSMFRVLDATSAACLVASAVLRNERYKDYYYFRVIALILSISLWITVAVEFRNYSLLLIAAMYLSYLIFDVGTAIEQKLTYENEYMQIVKRYKEIENKKVVDEKLKTYSKSKKSK